MLKGLRKSESFEYISERDPNKDRESGATVFTLGSIPVDVRTAIQDGLMDLDTVMGGGKVSGAGLSLKTSQQNLKAVRFGLKSAENFVIEGDDGKETTLDFQTEELEYMGRKFIVPTLDYLAHYPTWLINELGRLVLGSNAVSAAERKN